MNQIEIELLQRRIAKLENQNIALIHALIRVCKVFVAIGGGDAIASEIASLKTLLGRTAR